MSLIHMFVMAAQLKRHKYTHTVAHQHTHTPSVPSDLDETINQSSISIKRTSRITRLEKIKTFILKAIILIYYV